MNRRWCIQLFLLLLVACSANVDTGDLATTGVTESLVATSKSPSTSQVVTTVRSSTTSSSRVFESQDFLVPFRFPIREGWTAFERTPSYGEVARGVRYLIITTLGPGDTEAWIEFVSSNPSAEMTEPIEISLGGRPGVSLDVEVSENAEPSDACQGEPCVRLLSLPPAANVGEFWGVPERYRDRIWLIETGDQTVALLTEASLEVFDEWWQEIEPALAAWEWVDQG